MAIRKAGDRDQLQVKMAIYGKPDTGKTYAATRLSEKFRTLVLDAEGGSMSAPGSMPVGDFEDAQEIFKNQKDYPSAILRLTTAKEFADIWKLLKSANGRFEVVVIDTITEAQRQLIASLCEMDAATTKELNTLSLQGWGALSNKFRNFVRWFRDLPCHVVFIAHERYVGDDDSGVQRWVPLFEGSKTSFEFVGLLDVVGHAIKRERVSNGSRQADRLIRFVSNGREEAKVRGGRLDEEQPDLCAIFEKLLQDDTPKAVSSGKSNGNGSTNGNGKPNQK